MAQDPKDPAYITTQLAALYATYGQRPGAAGSGPLDAGYYAQQIIAHGGGWVDNSATGGPNNIGYWTDRINHDLTSAGYSTSGATGTTPAAPGAAPGTRPPGNRPPDMPGTTVVGTAVPIGTAENGPLAAGYEAAYAAAAQARRKSAGSGRASTVLGGFAPGSPSIQPATLLGQAA